MGSSNGTESLNECCMCGDYGIPSHLFKCKHCGFRSQHNYCSDLYPKARSYDSCNWCLSQKGDMERGELSDCPKDQHVTTKISKDQIKIKGDEARTNRTCLGPGRNTNAIGRRMIRRTRSEEISNGAGRPIKQVLRNKVRRYKLLDEVSC